MAFDKLILRDEVLTDPLGRVYSGMTDQQVADSLNAIDRTRIRPTIPAIEVIEATDALEYAGLSAGEKQRYGTFISAGEINPSGANTLAAFSAMFPGGTATRANLIAARDETISRATELGLPTIRAGWVEWVRLP